jgi:hypothetical protein
MSRCSELAIANIQPELLSGENILWAGKPNPGVIFHREDLFLIPFSLLWGGFAIFWEMGVAGMLNFGSHSQQQWGFGMVWGIPFVVAGQYLIWGRFLYVFWKKNHIFYAVTDRRVIAVQNAPSRKVASAYIDTLPTLIKSVRNDGIGTLNFAQTDPLWSRGRGWGTWDATAFGNVPAFVDVDDADVVHRMIAELRERTRTVKAF